MDNMKAAYTRGLVLAPVAALLLSVAILLLGNGLLGTLLIVRAGQEGFSAAAISAMMSFYFAGFTIGALVLPRIIVSVGRADLRRLCGDRIDDRPSPCSVRRSGNLDAASARDRLRICGYDPRNGKLAQCPRGSIHTRSAFVDFRRCLNGFLGDRTGAPQHRSTRRCYTFPHRLAADICRSGSDHSTSSHSPADVRHESVAFRDLFQFRPWRRSASSWPGWP